MKKIINGKLYHTESALEIARWQRGNRNDGIHAWCIETLHRMKSGGFLLHGDVDKDTEWAWPARIACDETDVHHDPVPGPDLMVLSEGEVLIWLEDRRINPDSVAEYFTFEKA